MKQNPRLFDSAGCGAADPSVLSVWTCKMKGLVKLETIIDAVPEKEIREIKYVIIINKILMKKIVKIKKSIPAEVVTELKTIPQILSTQIFGVPFWDVDKVFVAQGILIQSVLQSNPTLLPSEGDPPEKSWMRKIWTICTYALWQYLSFFAHF